MNHACSEHIGPLLGYCDHQVHKRMDERLRAYDVSPMQCRVLMYLCKQEEDIHQKTLEEYLMVKPSTVNGIVERLEKKGLLTRSASKSDARCRILSLTEDGRRFHSAFLEVVSSVSRQMERGFGPEELEQLRSYLLRVAENLKTEEE
ncbi:MAG: MarR family transcriptional regulator [Clostridiales bacterium]|nr:MarR family transcriptional regulator [Clostridiales bacterium]